MVNAENVLWAGVFFAILLTAYGSATGGPSAQTAINRVVAPFPTLPQQVPPTGCGILDFNCQASNVQKATAYIGAMIGAGVSTFVSILDRISGFGTFVSILLTGPIFGPSAVPYLPLVGGGLLLIVAFEVFRMFRGNASGGTM